MMTSSLGVAILLLCLGMSKYVESTCEFTTTRNARTLQSSQLFYSNGESVLTVCFSGHATNDLRTEFTRTCSAGGVWEPTLECNPVTCEGLPVVEGADIIYLSSMEVVDSLYPVLATALVICPPGMTTERGRLRYLSQCAITATWNDTSPCSVSLTPDTMEFAEFQLQLTEVSIQFTPALSDPTSPQAQSLAESLDRALFQVFEAEFGASYVGSRDYEFSEAPGPAGGVTFGFTMLFLPSVTFDLETLRLDIISALNRVNDMQSDPNTGTPYTFQRDSLDVSQEPVSQFTRQATIGLSITGALVAILFLTVIVMCCCCRQNTKPFSVFKPVSTPGPLPYTTAAAAPSPPPPAILSPYAQISDVPYGLPRVL